MPRDVDEWFESKASIMRALLKAECKVAGLLTDFWCEAEDQGHLSSHSVSLMWIQGYNWLLHGLHALTHIRACR